MANQTPNKMAIEMALEHCGIKSIAHVLGVIRPDGSIDTYISDKLNTQPEHLVAALRGKLLKASGPPNQDGRPQKRYLPLRLPSNDETVHSEKRAVHTLSTHTIAIGDDAARYKFYSQCFKDIQQNGCKVLGKAWVKLLAPKKQSTYPYTKGEQKMPPWWPATTGLNKIRHKEPDHLHKRERIILLMHILGLVVSQDPSGPIDQQIDIAKLEKVTYEAMNSWFEDKNKPKNATKSGFLDQLFYVLYEEERYRKGELDASATVSINPGSDDGDSGLSPCQTRSARPIPPSLPAPPSTLSPSATTTAASDNYYSSPHPLLPSFTSNTTLDEHTSTNPYIMSNHGLLIRQQHPQQPTYTPQPFITLNSDPTYWARQQFAYSLPNTSSPPERQWIQQPMAPVGKEADSFGGVDRKGDLDGGWGWGVI